jgi:hypothetical protein
VIFPFTIILINVYKKKFTGISFDLNELNKFPIDFDIEYQDSRDDPFETIRDFNMEEYYLNTLSTALYNPPLTLKLFPKSNLYGHELIRYYDL